MNIIKNWLNRPNRKVIYTAIFGDKDDLQPIEKQKGFDYIVFTDNPTLKLPGFKILLCPSFYEDPTRNAKYYKILSHIVLKEYDYSVWIDANIKMTVKDMNVLLKNYLQNHDMAVHAHPERNCIYEEAKECIKLGKDKTQIINHQMDRYRELGYQEQNGLISAGILIRRHTSSISKLNEMWWEEIEHHSRRDQLSFNYVVWQSGFRYYIIPGHVRNHNVEGFTLYPHKR